LKLTLEINTAKAGTFASHFLSFFKLNSLLFYKNIDNNKWQMVGQEFKIYK